MPQIALKVALYNGPDVSGYFKKRSILTTIVNYKALPANTVASDSYPYPVTRLMRRTGPTRIITDRVMYVVV